MTSSELRCDELVEIITDYLEGSLDDAQREAVERHLVDCPGCDAYLEQMRETIHQIGRLRVEDVPASAMDDLLAAFRAARPR